MIGKVLCLPKANKTPRGKEKVIPDMATIKVNISPFQTFTSTDASPKLPPTSHREIGKERNHAIAKTRELTSNRLHCCPMTKPTAIAPLMPNVKPLKSGSTGSKIARATDKEPIAIATVRLNRPHSPHEIPAKLPAIARTPHNRQNSVTGYKPTKNRRKLLLTTSHWALVVAQIQRLLTDRYKTQIQIIVSRVLNQLLKRFFFAHCQAVCDICGGSVTGICVINRHLEDFYYCW